MATDGGVFAAMSALAEEYGERFRVSDDRCELWLALMPDVEDKALMSAVIMYLRGANPHPPTPGQLLKLAQEASGARPSDESLEAQAHRDWEVAHRFIRGDWYPPDLSRWDAQALEESFERNHPRAAAVLKRLGIPTDLGQAKVGDAVRNIRPNFVKTYIAMSRDAQQRREHKKLGGPEAMGSLLSLEGAEQQHSEGRDQPS